MGDGQAIKIRGDRWLPMGILHGPPNKDDPVLVADLIDPIHQTWKQPILLTLFGEKITEENVKLPIRHLPIEDRLIRTATQNGEYTVKSCYHNISQTVRIANNNRASSSYQNPKILWRRIWSMQTAPK